MEATNLLIVGARGQLGIALQEQYPSARAVDADELDITDLDALQTFDWAPTTHILNAAAYTNVDEAETLEGRRAAWKVNATGAANLARVALMHDMTLVHVSTDYVFDGDSQNHTETEPFSPLGVYGQAKAAGDLAVALTLKHYIVRTSWVIGDGKNFVRTMLGLGQKGIAPTVVSDQIGRLTFTTELVRIIDHLLTTQPSFGTYNASNDGEPASWADVTRAIFSAGNFDLTVTDISTADYYAGKEDIAPRPLQSTLDLTKLHATGFISHDWHDDLKDYITKELS